MNCYRHLVSWPKWHLWQRRWTIIPNGSMSTTRSRWHCHPMTLMASVLVTWNWPRSWTKLRRYRTQQRTEFQLKMMACFMMLYDYFQLTVTVRFSRLGLMTCIPRWCVHCMLWSCQIKTFACLMHIWGGGGGPKISGIVTKIYLKIFVQVWNFSPLQSSAPVTGCSHCWKHCLKSSTGMLSRAAGNSRWISATLAECLHFKTCFIRGYKKVARSGVGWVGGRGGPPDDGLTVGRNMLFY